MCPIPAPAAAGLTGHSKGCSKDFPHEWVLFFCFALWKDSVAPTCSQLKCLENCSRETGRDGHKGGRDVPGVGILQRMSPTEMLNAPKVQPRTNSNIFSCVHHINTILILLLLLCRLSKKFNVQATV